MDDNKTNVDEYRGTPPAAAADPGKAGEGRKKKGGGSALLALAGLATIAAAVAWLFLSVPPESTGTDAGNSADTENTGSTAGEGTEGGMPGDAQGVVTVSITDSQGRTESYTVPTDGGTVSDVISDAAGMGIVFAVGTDNVTGQTRVSAVNGVKASGNAYWLCYINGSHTEAGIDSISVQNSDVVSFVWTEFAG